MADGFNILTALGRTAVGTVTFRTTVTPPVSFEPFADAPPVPPGPPNPFLALLKPTVEIDGSVVYAPHGEARADYTPYVYAGLGLLVFSLVGIGGLVGKIMSGKALAVTAGAGLAALLTVASQAQHEVATA